MGTQQQDSLKMGFGNGDWLFKREEGSDLSCRDEGFYVPKISSVSRSPHDILDNEYDIGVRNRP